MNCTVGKTSPYSFLITNSIKMLDLKLNIQRMFDNPFSKFLSKEFLGWIGYVSSYLPKLEYVQQVSSSALDLKTPSSKPIDVLGWNLEINPTTGLFLIK